MAFSVKILADSLAPCGQRLTTMEWTYPRPIHSEIMTHRMLSKNSASSRAIPPEKLIERILDDPWVPEYIGANQKGMAPGEELTGEARAAAVNTWLGARDVAIVHARELIRLKVHKGVVNRLLEPWMWITIIISGTEWPNLFALRLDKMAEPHFQHVARMAWAAMDASTPRKLAAGEWHLPLVTKEDISLVTDHVAGRVGQFGLAEIGITGDIPKRVEDLAKETLKKVSVGRCARVSYLTHDGRRDVKEDVALHDKLVVQSPLHASPAEHVAMAMDWPTWWPEAKSRWPALRGADSIPEMIRIQRALGETAISTREHGPELDILARVLSDMRSGNFYGFTQYRKMLPNENITSWAEVPLVRT
jgi:hypothetical protein